MNKCLLAMVASCALLEGCVGLSGRDMEIIKQLPSLFPKKNDALVVNNDYMSKNILTNGFRLYSAEGFTNKYQLNY